MTETEFEMIRAAMKSAYPTHNIMPDKYSIRLWYRLLSDIEYKTCETALFELFSTHKFPPQIAEIREKCAEYTTPQLMDEGEAYGLVKKAIQTYGYYRTEEAMESLPEPIRKAVETIGFREMCLDENETATRAHFYRSYSAIVGRTMRDASLPAAVLEDRNRLINAIEQKRQEHIEAAPEGPGREWKAADPEYVAELMKKHGLRK